MNKFFEIRVPFFRPLWRRVLATGAILGWAGVELALGNGPWAAIFGAAGIYLVWAFFIAFEAGPPGQEEEDKTE